MYKYRYRSSIKSNCGTVIKVETIPEINGLNEMK